MRPTIVYFHREIFYESDLFAFSAYPVHRKGRQEIFQLGESNSAGNAPFVRVGDLLSVLGLEMMSGVMSMVVSRILANKFGDLTSGTLRKESR